MNEDTADGAARGPGLRRPALAAAMAATALAAAAVLTACGGGSHSPTPSAQPGQLSVQKLDAFARCMRGHGMPDFYFTRSPSRSSLLNSNLYYIKLGQWVAPVNPTSPQFQPARQACDSLLGIPPESPQVTAAQLRSLVKAASCMRAHGFPAFPDPTVQNGQLVRQPLPVSIDTSSPQFAAALQTCHATT